MPLIYTNNISLDFTVHCFVGIDGNILTCYLFNAVSTHVEQHAAVDDAAAELKQTVEGKSGDVWLAPPLPTILYIFLKLQPPAA